MRTRVKVLNTTSNEKSKWMINRSGVSIYKKVLLGTRGIQHQRPTSDIIPGYHSMQLRLKVLEQTLCHTSSSTTIPDDMLCIYDNAHPTYKSATGITREQLRICVRYARDWRERQNQASMICAVQNAWSYAMLSDMLWYSASKFPVS